MPQRGGTGAAREVPASEKKKKPAVSWGRREFTDEDGEGARSYRLSYGTAQQLYLLSAEGGACSMFVKKDTRKIPDILADDNDEREELHLGRKCVRAHPCFQKLTGVQNFENDAAQRYLTVLPRATSSFE